MLCVATPGGVQQDAFAGSGILQHCLTLTLDQLRLSEKSLPPIVVEPPLYATSDSHDTISTRLDPETGGQLRMVRPRPGHYMEDFETGNRERILATRPQFLAQFGLKKGLLPGVYQEPDATSLNVRIRAMNARKDPNAPLVEFVSVDGEAEPVHYLTLWSEGKFVVARDGMLHFHDMNLHVPGIFLLNRRVEEALRSSQSRARGLLRLYEAFRVSVDPRDEPIAKRLWATIEHQVNALDNATNQLAEGLGAESSSDRIFKLISGLKNLQGTSEMNGGLIQRFVVERFEAEKRTLSPAQKRALAEFPASYDAAEGFRIQRMGEALDQMIDQLH